MSERVVLTGTPGSLTEVRPQDVPDDLRDRYFGGGPLRDAKGKPLPPALHLTGDWTRKDMTNVSIIHCDVGGWAPPGDPTQPLGYTRNHGMYRRFNVHIEEMIPAPYICWSDHEEIAAFLAQEAKRHERGRNRRIMERAVKMLLGDYRQSWAPMLHKVGPEMLEAARVAFRTHPELLEWCERIPAELGQIADAAFSVGNLRVDAALIAELAPLVPHFHDRWAFERLIEERARVLHPGPLTAPLCVHLWRLLPLRGDCTLSDDPDWWLGRFGG